MCIRDRAGAIGFASYASLSLYGNVFDENEALSGEIVYAEVSGSQVDSQYADRGGNRAMSGRCRGLFARVTGSEGCLEFIAPTDSLAPKISSPPSEIPTSVPSLIPSMEPSSESSDTPTRISPSVSLSPTSPSAYPSSIPSLSSTPSQSISPVSYTHLTLPTIYPV